MPAVSSQTPTPKGAANSPITGSTSTASGSKNFGKLSPRVFTLANAAATNTLAISQAGLSAQVGLAPAGKSGSLETDQNGLPILSVRVTDTSAATTSLLTQHGANVIFVSPTYRQVDLSIAPKRIEELAGLAQVQYIGEDIKPMGGANAQVDDAGTSAPQAGCSPIISEGDEMLKAATARSLYNIDGSGVSVGVMSDTYNDEEGEATTAAQDIASGDLPGTGNPCGRTTAVNVVQDGPYGGDEGRAMLQTVHDLAPGASLMFDTAYVSSTTFAQQMTDLHNAGAKVISDDFIYYDEPMYQDGPVAVAANNNRAASPPTFMVTMASNDNLINNGISWNGYEAPNGFRGTPTSSPCPATIVTFYGDGVQRACHDFSGNLTNNAYNFTIAKDGVLDVDLQWNEPWYGVSTDLDFFLVDKNSRNVVAYSINQNTSIGAQTDSEEPFEFIAYGNTTGAAEDLQLYVVYYIGTAKPRFKFVFTTDGQNPFSNIQYATPVSPDTAGGTIFGHNGAASELTMGATAYNSGTAVEDYSSHGPVFYDWGPVINTTAASAITPVTLNKPDVIATDGASNTFYGHLIGGVWHFLGTSDASPHGAAVAALLLQLKPTLTMNQLKTAITSTATAMSGGVNVAGTGLVNALAAANSVSGGTGTCTGGTPYRNLSGSWVPIPGAVSYLAADRNGGGTTSVWALGTNPLYGGCQVYQYVGGGSTWAALNASASSMTVDNTGQPWVLQSFNNHAIYRYNAGTWTSIPGAAYEISAGAGGDIWAIGTNLVGPGGHGIYKYVGAPNWWQPINGAADHIAVGPDNVVWLIQTNGDIYRYSGGLSGTFTAIPGKARQISVGYDNTLYVIGTNAVPGGYGIYRYTGGPSTWAAIGGGAVQVAGGGSGEFWVHQGGAVPPVPNAIAASGTLPFVPPLPAAVKPAPTSSPQAVNPPSQTPQQSPAPSGNTLPGLHQ